MRSKKSVNEIIGRALGFKPVVMYAVSNGNNYCYVPYRQYKHNLNAEAQKVECERWLRKIKEKYPDCMIAIRNYRIVKIEKYPSFHKDWNNLIKAVVILKNKGFEIDLETDIKNIWQSVFQVILETKNPI